jgi:peptidoglycan hydrolase CwlO-like protein
MIKKVIIVVVAVLVVAVLLFGRSAVSYIRTSAGYVKESVRNAVPMEFEIKRARGEIENLLPEVRKNMYVIAKEEVEVQRLQEQITKAEEELGKDKGGIMQLNAFLKSGKEVLQCAHRSFSPEQVKADLASRFKRYKTNEATLGSLRQILAARQQSLDAARQKLDGMLAAKRELKVEVENLEARLQMVAAAQATSRCQFDDSRLGRVKELVSDLRTRLDVAERLANAETSFHGEIPLEETAPENIVDQVTEYFSGSTPAAEVVAAN